jgi:hypothetical protein
LAKRGVVALYRKPSWLVSESPPGAAAHLLQGGVVLHAQIATEPDKGGGHGVIERGYSGTD